MRKKTAIPVESLAGKSDIGIAIAKIPFDDLRSLENTKHAHRHDFHFFLFLENGSSTMEIDFENYEMKKSDVLYIHPNQVHRTLKAENADACFLVVNNEYLNPTYLKLLEDITPTQPLSLNVQNRSIITDMISLCINIFQRKQDKLYLSLLKDSCNTLVALILSPYLEQSKPADKLSRFDIVTKKFKSALERKFTILKRPVDYAQELNISVPYLNECVKNTSGYPVSYHIQQRIILEAKRLLYHSDKSVKEIAAELGYDDYAYFSRLFSRATGMTALTFRNKNLD